MGAKNQQSWCEKGFALIENMQMGYNITDCVVKILRISCNNVKGLGNQWT